MTCDVTRRRFLGTVGAVAVGGSIAGGVAPGGTAVAVPNHYQDELGLGLFGSVSTPAEQIVLVNPGFEDGLAGWQVINVRSPATAVIQDGAGRDDSAGAVIEVPEEATVGFPGFALRMDTPPATTLVRFSAWLRSEQVRDGNGPYLAVNFYNADGVRVSFDRSSNDWGKNYAEWTRLEIVIDVPAGMASMLLVLHLHGRGIVTFDDVELVFHAPEPAEHAPLVLGSTTGQVLKSGLAGMGAENEPYVFSRVLNDLTEADLQTYADRLATLRLGWVRIFTTTYWWATRDGVYDFTSDMAQATLETLRIYDAAGTSAHVVMQYPTDWTAPEFPLLAETMVALIEEARGRGIGNVKALTLYNERTARPGEPGGFLGTPEQYAEMYQIMGDALIDAGMTDVGLVGVDSGSNADDWFDFGAALVADTVAQLSFHEYLPDYRMSLRSQVQHAGRMAAVGAAVGVPNVYMWESNITGIGRVDGMGRAPCAPTAMTWTACHWWRGTRPG